MEVDWIFYLLYLIDCNIIYNNTGLFWRFIINNVNLLFALALVVWQSN